MNATIQLNKQLPVGHPRAINTFQSGDYVYNPCYGLCIVNETVLGVTIVNMSNGLLYKMNIEDTSTSNMFYPTTVKIEYNTTGPV